MSSFHNLKLQWVVHHTGAYISALNSAIQRARGGEPTCIDLQGACLSWAQHQPFLESLEQVMQQPGTKLKLVNGTWDMGCVRSISVSCKLMLEDVHVTGFGAVNHVPGPVEPNRNARRLGQRMQKKHTRSRLNTAFQASLETIEAPSWANMPNTNAQLAIPQFTACGQSSITCRRCTFRAAEGDAWVKSCSAFTAQGSGARLMLQDCTSAVTMWLWVCWVQLPWSCKHVQWT